MATYDPNLRLSTSALASGGSLHYLGVRLRCWPIAPHPVAGLESEVDDIPTS